MPAPPSHGGIQAHGLTRLLEPIYPWRRTVAHSIGCSLALTIPWAIIVAPMLALRPGAYGTDAPAPDATSSSEDHRGQLQLGRSRLRQYTPLSMHPLLAAVAPGQEHHTAVIRMPTVIPPRRKPPPTSSYGQDSTPDAPCPMHSLESSKPRGTHWTPML